MRAFAFDSVTVTMANAVVHVSNYVVVAGIAALFGATWQTDAFFLALTFPTFFVSAIVSAVGSVFIPIFSECRINRPQVLGQLIGSALLYVFLATALIALLMVALAPFVLQRVLREDTSFGFQQLVIQQTFLMLPVIVIQTLTGVISAFYSANSRYLYPPVTDALSTFSILVIIAITRSRIGINSVPLGFVGGAILHLLLLLLLWSRLNVRVTWTWKAAPELRQSLGLALPLVLGTAALQFGTVISRFLAAQFPEGSVTILDYASRISYGIMELLTSGVLLVVLARWSQTGGNHTDTERLRREVQSIVLMVSFVVMPIVLLVIALRQSLVAVVFQRGSFDEALTIATAGVLVFYLLGIPFDAIARIYVRLFLVWRNTWTLGSLAFLRVLFTILAALALMKVMGMTGIALADTLSILFVMVILVRGANRKLGNTFSGSGLAWLKITFGAMSAAVVSVLLGRTLAGKELLLLVIAGAAGSIIYVAISFAIRSDQLRAIVGLLTSRSSKDISP